MAGNIDTVVNYFDRSPSPKIDLTRERSTTVIMGHSFIRNLNLELADFMSKNWGLYSREYLLKCDDIEVKPFLYGIKGATIEHMGQLIEKSRKMKPSVIILDLGSNDLCWNSCLPTKLASSMVETAQSLFNVYHDLELVALCHITQKLYMWEGKGDKSITSFNQQAVTYNEKITELVRQDVRLMKWTHRGVFNITKEITSDGTHLNTPQGSYKYYSSICNLLRCSKKELILRRNETAQEACNRRTQQKKRKERARMARREAEHQEQIAGEMYNFQQPDHEQYAIQHNPYYYENKLSANQDTPYAYQDKYYNNELSYYHEPQSRMHTECNWYKGVEDTEAEANLISSNAYYPYYVNDIAMGNQAQNLQNYGSNSSYYQPYDSMGYYTPSYLNCNYY
jgi:lysophospholipase L1-like esterase